MCACYKKNNENILVVSAYLTMHFIFTEFKSLMSSE